MLDSQREWTRLIVLIYFVLLIGALIAGPPKHNAKQYQASYTTENVSVQDASTEAIARYTEVVAYFTAILAISTAGLWIVTWHSGRKQMRDMRETIKLARDEFVATHRPKIIVQNFATGSDMVAISDQPGGQRITPVLLAYNIGDSDAFIVGIKSTLCVLENDPKIPPHLLLPCEQYFNIRLSSGQKRQLNAVIDWAITPIDASQVLNGFRTMYCIGIITYMDERDAEREIGFCRRYIPSEERWIPVDNPEYEYAY